MKIEQNHLLALPTRLHIERFDDINQATEIVWNKGPLKRALDTKVQLISENGESYGLTERQFEVLELICNYGLSNREIGQVLEISHQTVKNHLCSLFEVFGTSGKSLNKRNILVAKIFSEGVAKIRTLIDEDSAARKFSNRKNTTNSRTI